MAVCFHALSHPYHPQPDHEETTATTWFEPAQIAQSAIRPRIAQLAPSPKLVPQAACPAEVPDGLPDD
jgi:hypothetical protein